jgi:hypothetical protein
MYRPWDEDPRPAWQVTAVWATPRGHHDTDDHDLLLTTLQQTGHVRGQTLDTAYGRLTLTMLVRADGPERAEHAAVRIGEVAYHAAGLGHLGANLSSTATAHAPISHDQRP